MALTRLVIVSALMLPLLSPPVVSADNEVMPHVRAEDAIVASALARGSARSVTFRALVDRLNGSNVIVHVERAHIEERCDGKTQFVAAAAGYRFLRITVRAALVNDALIALLGHELQHATEVADALWVVNQESYGMLYARIGRRSPSCRRVGWCFETRAAVDSGYRVLAELRGRTRRVDETLTRSPLATPGVLY
jgi:hypothetical protein